MILGLKAGQRQTAKHGAVLVVNDRDDHPITFQQTSVSIEVTHEGAPTVFFPDYGNGTCWFHDYTGDSCGPRPLSEGVLPPGTGWRRVRAGQGDRGSETGQEVGQGDGGPIRVGRRGAGRMIGFRFEVGASNSPNSTEDDIDIWMVVRVVVRDV